MACGLFDVPDFLVEKIIASVVEADKNALRVLPLVSKTWLRNLQRLQLPFAFLKANIRYPAGELKRLLIAGETTEAIEKTIMAQRDVTLCRSVEEVQRVYAAQHRAWEIAEINLCRSREVTDVSAFANFIALRKLNLCGTGVTDVSALVGCLSLQELNLYETDVTDISSLARSKALHKLCLGSTRVTDLSALATCPNLCILDLDDCWELQNVSALAVCAKLHTLSLRDCTEVTDVSALAGCAALHTLDLKGCTALPDAQSLPALLSRVQITM